MAEINQHIEDILRDYKRIAVVGLSDKPHRASNGVARFMLMQGYTVIPVNPGLTEVLGLKAYPSLVDIPEAVDLVDVFRAPKYVDEIVEQAIEIGAKGLWLQLGVINPSAAQKALDAGLKVVMDRCWKIEYQRLFL
ncbi:MAG: CoA-binding protein [Methanobacteriota archaeon]|nr:MAG: CoA-binding protein [Euryarchaeota archaeon]